MRTLAIVIRAHGTIPIHYDYGKSIPEIFDPTVFDYKHTFHINSITSIALAKLGGVCYGSSNVKEYVNNINKLKPRLNDEEFIKTTDQLIDYLYNTKKLNSQLLEIKNLNQEMFNISYPPEIMTLGDRAIEKIYTYDNVNNEGLGVYVLSSTELNGQDVNTIINRFNQLNELLRTEGVLYKTQILHALSEFNLDKLYYIDFSCFGLHSVLNVHLTEDAANWIISVMEDNKLKGGKRVGYKKRVGQKMKNTIRCKRRNIKKKNKTRNRKL